MENKWSSGRMFLLAAVGSAVGLANIWRFPYIVGVNGGGAFVLVYVASMILVTIPLLVSEIALGRRGGGDPITSMTALAAGGGLSPKWRSFGWLSLITTLTVLSFYSVISGWSLAYIPKMLAGLANKDVAHIQAEFVALTADPKAMILWHGIFMAVSVTVVAHGLQRGIEAAVRVLMPVLFASVICLAAYGAAAGDFGAAVTYLFTPDFSKLNFEAVLMAVGSAFFSASVGVGALMTYGAYLPQSVSIWWVAAWTAIIDLLVALLAGLAVFSIIFAHGLDPDGGPGLVFVALPVAFSQMPGGLIVGLIFFLLFFLASFTSAFSLLEPTVLWLTTRYRVSRTLAAWSVGIAVWVAGFATVFSFNYWKNLYPLAGMARFHESTIFNLLDVLVTNVFLPFGALTLTIFTGWRVSRLLLSDELQGAARPRLFSLWLTLVRYMVPLALVAIFLGNLL